MLEIPPTSGCWGCVPKTSRSDRCNGAAAGSSPCCSRSPQIIPSSSGSDKGDGLFNSVMNVVPETFSSAAGHTDSSPSASASLYIALIDYDEALSSLVITILIGRRCRRTEGGRGEDFTRRLVSIPLVLSLCHFFLLTRDLNSQTDFSV